MKTRTLSALVVVGAAVLACGWYFGPRTEPTDSRSIDIGKPMFADLAPKLQAAAEIDIVHQGKTVAIHRQNGVWGLVERGGYPVPAEKVRAVMLELAELRLVEPRTSNPAEFSRLGLDDPAKPGASGNLLKVNDASGKPLAELIVGHSRTATTGNTPAQVYVRRPGEDRTWLADGALQVDADPMQWLPREIVDIASTRVAAVSVERAGQSLHFTQKDGKLTMTEPAQHPPLDDAKVENLGRGLEQLTLEDVRPAAQEPVGASIGQAAFTTTDGLAITVMVQHAGKDGDKGVDKTLWARLSAAGDGKAKAEADKLNARLAGWSYEIGSWKEAALVPSMESLKAPPPPAKPETPPAASVPTQ